MSRAYKIGLIKCLLDRAWKICDCYESIHSEFTRIKSMLLKNEYPSNVIDFEIIKSMSIKFGEGSKKESVEKTKNKVIYLVLPYVDDKFEDFKLKLIKLVKDFYHFI